MALEVFFRDDLRRGITSSAFTIIHCGRSSDFILGALTGLQAQALLYDIDLPSILAELRMQDGITVLSWLKSEFGYSDLAGLLA